MTNDEIEVICMGMIGYAGEARTLIFDVIESLFSEKLEGSTQKLEQAEQMLNEAHKIQFTKLMQPQANGEAIPFHLLLIHAMDMVMGTTSELDLAKKLLIGCKTKLEASK
jgi:PTS system cellobiose-specific IIA component